MSELQAFGDVNESAPVADASPEATQPDPSEQSEALAVSPAIDPAAGTDKVPTEESTEKPSEKDESGAGKEGEPKEDEDLSDEEVDKQLKVAADDPKGKPYYKNLLKQADKSFQRRLESATEPYKPLIELGEAEEIRESVQWAKSLDSVARDPETGLPAPTVKPFVERLMAKGVEKAVDVMIEIARTPSPDDPKHTLADEILRFRGIDPDKLPLITEFAKNGYRMQSGSVDDAELSLIREDLREAYTSFSQAERNRVLPKDYDDDDDAALKLFALEKQKDFLADEKAKSEQKTLETKQAEETKQAQFQAFQREVSEAADPIAVEAGGRVVDGFVSALTEQTGLSKAEGFDLAVRVQQAIKGQGTIGVKARELLKEEGVEIDPQLTQLVSDLDEQSGLISYFRHPRTKDAAGEKAAVSKLADIERTIGIKSKKIIAAVAAHRATANAGRIAADNKLLDGTQKGNLGLGTGHPSEMPLGVVPRNGQPLVAFPDSR